MHPGPGSRGAKAWPGPGCGDACTGLGDVLRSGRGGDEVVAETGQRGFGLGRPGGEQDLLAALRVGPPLAQWPAGALDPVAGDGGEPGTFDLTGQPAGRVEVGGGEELRAAHRI